MSLTAAARPAFGLPLVALLVAAAAAAAAADSVIGTFHGPTACYQFDGIGNPVMVGGVASITAGPSAALVARHWLDEKEQQGLAVEVASLATGLTRPVFNASGAVIISVDWQQNRVVTAECGAARVRSLADGSVLKTYGYPGDCSKAAYQTLASHAIAAAQQPLGFALVSSGSDSYWTVAVSGKGSVSIGPVPQRHGMVHTHISVAWGGGFANVASRDPSGAFSVGTMSPLTGGGGVVSSWNVPDPSGNGVQAVVPVCNSGKCEALLSSYSGETYENTYLADVDGMASQSSIFGGNENVEASLFVDEQTILVQSNVSVRRCRLYNIAPPVGGRPTADCSFASAPPGAPTAIDAVRPADGSPTITWIAASQAVRGKCGATTVTAYHA